MMGNTNDMKRLEDALTTAGSQWHDEDLDEILALLEKDYTHPQPEQPVMEPAEPEKDVLPEVNLLLDPEPRLPEVPEEPAPRPSMALPDLRSLMAEEESGAGALPHPQELRLEEEIPAPELREEFIPAQPQTVPIGEQPDFTDAPVKKQKPGTVVALSLVAAAEVAALVLIFLWWQQWIV